MTQAEQTKTIETVDRQDMGYGVRRDAPVITRNTAEELEIAVHSGGIGVIALEISQDEVRVRVYSRNGFSAAAEWRDQYVPLDPEVASSQKLSQLLGAYDEIVQSNGSPLATECKRGQVEDAIALIEDNRLEGFISLHQWPHGAVELRFDHRVDGKKLHAIEICDGKDMSIYARRGAKLDRAREAVATAIKAAEFMFDDADSDALWARYEQLRNQVAQELDAKRQKAKAERAETEVIEDGDLLILDEVWDYTNFGRTQVVSAHWRRSPRGRTILHGLFLDEHGNPARTRVNRKQMKGARKLTTQTISKISSDLYSAHEIMELLQMQKTIEERRVAKRAAHAAAVERYKA